MIDNITDKIESESDNITESGSGGRWELKKIK